MGQFDFLKGKSPEEKKAEKFNKIRLLSIIQEKRSIMQEMILNSEHDDSLLDENPNGIGLFGLIKTNPIPINGIDNISAYIDKLRYEYTSISGSVQKHTIQYHSKEQLMRTILKLVPVSHQLTQLLLLHLHQILMGILMCTIYILLVEVSWQKYISIAIH